MEAAEKPTDASALWYQVVDDDSLRQGDLFRGLVAYWAKAPAGDGTEVEVGTVSGDFIIVSASCDVDQKGYDYVLLNRVYAADETNLGLKGDDLQKAIEVIRRGLHPARFLLSSTESINPSLPLSFVTSKQHTLLSIQYLRSKCVGPRLRLRSPLREAFGSWVAACFGRVGIELSAQIPRLSANLYPGQVLKHAGE